MPIAKEIRNKDSKLTAIGLKDEEVSVTHLANGKAKIRITPLDQEEYEGISALRTVALARFTEEAERTVNQYFLVLGEPRLKFAPNQSPPRVDSVWIDYSVYSPAG